MSSGGSQAAAHLGAEVPPSRAHLRANCSLALSHSTWQPLLELLVDLYQPEQRRAATLGLAPGAGLQDVGHVSLERPTRLAGAENRAGTEVLDPARRSACHGFHHVISSLQAPEGSSADGKLLRGEALGIALQGCGHGGDVGAQPRVLAAQRTPFLLRTAGFGATLKQSADAWEPRGRLQNSRVGCSTVHPFCARERSRASND